MKHFILNVLLILSTLSSQCQDWKPWVEIQDGAYNKIEFSYKIVKNARGDGNTMYYRFKNGYSSDVCGAIYLSYTQLDGTIQNSYCNADFKANEIKEGNYMNRFDVATVKGITSVDIKYCDGKPLNISGTKSNSYFFAVCDDKLPLSSHGPTGWCGPKRTSYAEAQADAKAHNEKYNHQATVCTGDCPTCN